MPHPAAYGLVLTVRDDGPTKTVIVQDQDANVLAEVAIDRVPHGVRIDVTDSDDKHAGQVIAR